jgi:acyl carrier protein
MEKKLAGFVARETGADAASIGADTELLSSGLIDSVALVRMAALVEREAGIVIPDRDVTEENFETLGAIRSYVARRRAEA